VMENEEYVGGDLTMVRSVMAGTSRRGRGP
jgi:hypothetical protein